VGEKKYGGARRSGLRKNTLSAFWPNYSSLMTHHRYQPISEFIKLWRAGRKI